MATKEKAETTDAAPQFITLSPEQLREIVHGGSANIADLLKQQQASFDELHPRENKTPPKISAFNPAGDRDHPKPKLKCEMLWVGYPLEEKGLTRDEIELLNRADIGAYTFMRTDGMPDTLKIEGEADARGRMTKLKFYFPCKGDNRMNLPGMAAMLRSAFGLASVEQDEIAKLKAELATLQAVVANA